MDESTLHSRKGSGVGTAGMIAASALLAGIAVLGGVGAWYMQRRGWRIMPERRGDRPEPPREVGFRAAGRSLPPGARGRSRRNDEDQILRASEMTDAGDVAQNQMPGRPQNLAVGGGDPLDEARRREFEAMVRAHRGRS